MQQKHSPASRNCLRQPNSVNFQLRNAMYLWNKWLGKVVKQLGFKQEIAVDPCLYTRRDSNGRLNAYILYHVDDLLAFGRTVEIVSLIEKQFCEVLPIKLMGKPKRFIGIEFYYCANDKLLVHNSENIRYGGLLCYSISSWGPATY